MLISGQKAAYATRASLERQNQSGGDQKVAA
jgi:hypothetical protein